MKEIVGKVKTLWGPDFIDGLAIDRVIDSISTKQMSREDCFNLAKALPPSHAVTFVRDWCFDNRGDRSAEEAISEIIVVIKEDKV